MQLARGNRILLIGLLACIIVLAEALSKYVF